MRHEWKRDRKKTMKGSLALAATWGLEHWRRPLLWAEMLLIFVGVPLVLSLIPSPRRLMHVGLWVLCAYAVFWLTRSSDFSWRRLWEGVGWPKERRRAALGRFLVFAPLLLVSTWLFDPETLFRFPRERPLFWAAVMILYPLLSVVPQELMCRTFFFERYAALFARPTALIAVNAFLFGFVHIVFNNWFAPVLSALGGVLFAMSYGEHRSLKRVTIEHAAYGCLVFTLGLGWYFFRPAWG